MKARIVDMAELKKSQAEREAESLIQELLQNGGEKKALEVILEKAETPRKINNIFRRAAASLGKEIRITSKEGKTIVRIK